MTRVFTLQETRDLWARNQLKNQQTTVEYFDHLGIVTAADYFEHIVDKYASRLCIQDIQDEFVRHYTYATVNEHANRIAHWAQTTLQLKAHDVVALYMENCAEFIMFWVAMAKLGVTVACINTYITGKHVAHAIELAQTKHVIMSSKRWSTWSESVEHFEERDKYLAQLNLWIFDRSVTQEESTVLSNSAHELHSSSGPSRVPVSSVQILSLRRNGHEEEEFFAAEYSAENLPRSVRQTVTKEHPMFYIYTSGTTGKSKAALFSQKRVIGAGVSWSTAAELNMDDKYYICLPLYHGNGGVVAVSAVFNSGCSMVLREKFSATQFLNDIRKYECTAMIYIGELWRYIYNQPATEYDRDNKLRVIIGNGLRSDIWTKIVERFGIELVVEHYGQTEMIAAHPMMNCYNKVASCGFIPPEIWHNQNDEKLVKFDIEADQVYRNADGFCEVADIGEPGEDLVHLPNGMYQAYTSDEANEKKVYRDVFKKGDLWFRSGDLIKVDKDGFFYFVDRVGDTFRWKGENVATNEVSEAITKFEGVKEANVYGVVIPGTEGKGGMAMVQLDGSADSFDFDGLLDHLRHELPGYAIPLFLRIRNQESSKTSTLKFHKYEYQQEAFHLDKVPESDTIYHLSSTTKKYVELTREDYELIMQQRVRF